MNDMDFELKMLDEMHDKIAASRADYMTESKELSKHLNELFASIQRNIEDIRSLKEILKND